MSTLHTQYLDDIDAERNKLLNLGHTFFTEGDIIALPAPVQRYFRACGYIGSPKRMFGQVRWSGVELRLSPSARWRKIHCYEFLAAPEPLRISHLKTHIARMIPFEAIDRYQNGHGNMTVKLAAMLTLQDAKGSEMDQSALVTFLSECLLLPACALQPYIRWSPVKPNCAAATIHFNNTEARGRFYFNDRGEFIRFETGDRWQAGNHDRFTRCRWMVIASHYTDTGRIWRPQFTSAYWISKNEPWEYFKGRIEDIS
jgi:uncharacterized protein DUF6544